jgi:hypothetical protein
VGGEGSIVQPHARAQVNGFHFACRLLRLLPKAAPHLVTSMQDAVTTVGVQRGEGRGVARMGCTRVEQATGRVQLT